MKKRVATIPSVNHLQTLVYIGRKQFTYFRIFKSPKTNFKIFTVVSKREEVNMGVF